jgi:Cft2 family RNA processing exonuclease
MLVWDDGLKIRGKGLYLDSRQPRPLSFVSHAHSDHIGLHEQAIATPETSALAEYRIGLQRVIQLTYFKEIQIEEGVMELRPAGHVLGSAMMHYTCADGSILYTGDFKLRPCLTTVCAEPRPADFLLMECTYGQPFFKFPAPQQVAEELVERVRAALNENRQPIVMGYTLGKAQEITKILLDARLPVTLHGAVFNMHGLYEKHGPALGAVRKYARADFHGEKQVDLKERGVLVAPPYVARTPFVTAFKNPLTIMMSGWALLKGAPYRYGVDHVLPLSDHADFDELMELIERVAPKKIFTHHGPRSFAEILRARGFDAQPAEPDRQLSLFE